MGGSQQRSSSLDADDYAYEHGPQGARQQGALLHALTLAFTLAVRALGKVLNIDHCKRVMSFRPVMSLMYM